MKMKKQEFLKLESFMLDCMKDSAHDREHVYRVLHTALQIAEDFPEADGEILLAACLLHDIGREAQYADPSVDHASAGAEMALDFLLRSGWERERAQRVAAAIRQHRYRSGAAPESVEAKILFDADKLDVTGAMGIARTLQYQGRLGYPLYHLDEKGCILLGEEDAEPSFFREYAVKLKKLYGRFYTEAGAKMAENRKETAEKFYAALLKEIQAASERESLSEYLEE